MLQPDSAVRPRRVRLFRTRRPRRPPHRSQLSGASRPTHESPPASGTAPGVSRVQRCGVGGGLHGTWCRQLGRAWRSARAGPVDDRTFPRQAAAPVGCEDQDGRACVGWVGATLAQSAAHAPIRRLARAADRYLMPLGGPERAPPTGRTPPSPVKRARSGLSGRHPRWRPVGIVAITLFSPDPWWGAVSGRVRSRTIRGSAHVPRVRAGRPRERLRASRELPASAGS